MTDLRNDEIQAALIAYFKSLSNVTNLLITDDNPIGANEIREDQWQGDIFDYPNIRIRMISNIPGCPSSGFNVSIMAFSQSYSSLEADNIVGVVSELHGLTFTQDNILIFLQVTNIVPALRVDNRTWKSECIFRGTAVALYESWWLPSGLVASDCVVAYEFINKPNQAIAKLNLNDNATHLLVDGATPPEGWASTKGFWNDSVLGWLVSDIVADPSGLWSWFLEWTGAFDTNKGIFGARNGSSIFGFYNKRTTGFMRFCNFNNEETYPAAFGTYVGVSNRKCYVNGIHVRTMGAPLPAILPVILILAGSGGMSPIDRGEVHRLVIWNKPITDAQMLSVTNYAISNPPV